MFAAASGKADAVKLLLDKGADVNAKETASGETPLMFAPASNRVEAMKVLIERCECTAATKVVDLKAQTNPEEEVFLRAAGRSARLAPQQPAVEVLPQAAPAAPAAAAQSAPKPRRPVGVTAVGRRSRRWAGRIGRCGRLTGSFASRARQRAGRTDAAPVRVASGLRGSRAGAARRRSRRQPDQR